MRAIFGADKNKVAGTGGFNSLMSTAVHTAQPGARKRYESENMGTGFRSSGAMTANINNRKIRMNSYMTQKPSV